MAGIQQVDRITTVVEVTGGQKYQGDITKATQSLEGLATAQDKAAQSAGALSSGLAAFSALGIGMVFDSMAKGLVSSAGQMERFTAQFKVLQGSTSAAKERLSGLVEFAKVTPFDLPGVINADRMLQAFNLSVGSNIETLRLFGDTAAAMGVPIEQVIVNFAKLKAGMFDTRELAAIGLTREAFQKLGQTFTKTGEAVNREDLFATGIKIITRFKGTMEEVSKTTEGRLVNLQDALFQFSAAVGRGLTPMVKSGAAALSGLLNIMEKLDPALLQLMASGVVFGAALAKLAAISQGWITIQRLNVIAANTNAAAIARGTAALNADSIAETNSAVLTQRKSIAKAKETLEYQAATGASQTFIASMRQEIAAQEADLAVIEQKIIAFRKLAAAQGAATARAARSASVAAMGATTIVSTKDWTAGMGASAVAGWFARNFLGKPERIPWPTGAAAGGGLLAKMGGLKTVGQGAGIFALLEAGMEMFSREKGVAGEGIKKPSALTTFGSIAAGAAGGGPIGAGIGFIYAIDQLRYLRKHNQEIVQEGAKEIMRQVKQADAEIAKIKAAEVGKKEADHIANLEKSLVKQKEQNDVLDAQVKIAATRNKNDWDNIPAIKERLAGENQYLALITDLLGKLPKTVQGEEARAKLTKEYWATLVGVADLERSIADSTEKQAKAKEESRKFMEDVRHGAAEAHYQRMTAGWQEGVGSEQAYREGLSAYQGRNKGYMTTAADLAIAQEMEASRQREVKWWQSIAANARIQKDLVGQINAENKIAELLAAGRLDKEARIAEKMRVELAATNMLLEGMRGKYDMPFEQRVAEGQLALDEAMGLPGAAEARQQRSFEKLQQLQAQIRQAYADISEMQWMAANIGGTGDQQQAYQDQIKWLQGFILQAGGEMTGLAKELFQPDDFDKRGREMGDTFANAFGESLQRNNPWTVLSSPELQQMAINAPGNMDKAMPSQSALAKLTGAGARPWAGMATGLRNNNPIQVVIYANNKSELQSQIGGFFDNELWLNETVALDTGSPY